jgi:hypothetical protein
MIRTAVTTKTSTPAYIYNVLRLKLKPQTPSGVFRCRLPDLADGAQLLKYMVVVAALDVVQDHVIDRITRHCTSGRDSLVYQVRTGKRQKIL